MIYSTQAHNYRCPADDGPRAAAPGTYVTPPHNDPRISRLIPQVIPRIIAQSDLGAIRC